MTLDDKMYRYTQQKDFPAESIDGIVSEFDFKIFDNHTAMLTWKTSKSLGVAKSLDKMSTMTNMFSLELLLAIHF